MPSDGCKPIDYGASGARDVTAVSALDVPIRRRLYDYVRARQKAVSRDEASEALAVGRQTAAFHLDKLVVAGLLEHEFARLSGKSGPGAGRPSKLYRRANRDISVQLPQRSYEIAGKLLALAVDESARTGESPRDILGRRAGELGRSIGAEIVASCEGVLQALEEYGFEPCRQGEAIALANCPFHALVQDHAELVCGMNLDLITGMLDGASCDCFEAQLAPHEGYCCVRIEPYRP